MFTGSANPPTVFILGISSDIGRALAERYAREGAAVIGTFRNPSGVRNLPQALGIRLLPCDAASPESIAATVQEYRALGRPWDLFISCVGTLEPIGRFFDCDFSAWEKSVLVNSTAQLRMLHHLYPYRRKEHVCQVAFFAGGGTNNPFTNYSAYCLSKIMLIKMCELLDDETPDLNVFIVGTGWVRTKIHQQTLNQPGRAEENYRRTLEFMESGYQGTSYEDIYQCINWCISQGREVASGRNFSLVHDPWRQGGEELAWQLLHEPQKFKLRRFGNTEPEPNKTP
jgi:NAD(P)-dependent dehydrogenase (short-subunit alcohol dehydrogenase family)